MLKTGFEARESKSAHDVQRLFLQQSDICMLHLFESFLEAAPQLILQLYIMVVMRDWHFFTGKTRFFFITLDLWDEWVLGKTLYGHLKNVEFQKECKADV